MAWMRVGKWAVMTFALKGYPEVALSFCCFWFQLDFCSQPVGENVCVESVADWPPAARFIRAVRPRRCAGAEPSGAAFGRATEATAEHERGHRWRSRRLQVAAGGHRSQQADWYDFRFSDAYRWLNADAGCLRRTHSSAACTTCVQCASQASQKLAVPLCDKRNR